MKAGELIALAAAHGIDLRHVAGIASDTKGIAKKRRRTPKEIKDARGRPLFDSANTGGDDSGGAGPEWTVAEIGQASVGLEYRQWLAACYSFAGDRNSYWPLHRELSEEARRLARHYRWPSQAPDQDGRPRFYLESLAQLVLDEDAHQHIFRSAPQLYSVYMGVSDEVWSRGLAERFVTLRMRYEVWLAQAAGMIQRRINSEHI